MTKLQPIEGLAICCFTSLVVFLLATFVNPRLILLTVPGTLFGAWFGARV